MGADSQYQTPDTNEKPVVVQLGTADMDGTVRNVVSGTVYGVLVQVNGDINGPLHF